MFRESSLIGGMASCEEYISRQLYKFCSRSSYKRCDKWLHLPHVYTCISNGTTVKRDSGYREVGLIHVHSIMETILQGGNNSGQLTG